jgi:hypothetical protein
MLSKATAERFTGILFLVIIPVALATTFLDSGVDTRVNEFRGSLQEVADSETENVMSAVFGFIMSGLFVAAAAGLYVTFRSNDRLLPLLGAFGFLAAGVSFMASMAAGLAFTEMAAEFGDTSGVAADQIVPAARAFGIASDWSLFMGFAFYGMGLLALGILIIGRGPLPRWLGWLAAISGVLTIVGAPTFFLLILGLLLSLVWLLFAGGLLVLRGTDEAGAPAG